MCDAPIVADARRCSPRIRARTRCACRHRRRSRRSAASSHGGTGSTLADAAAAARSRQQLSTLQYTGGTTGRSKGVDLVHRRGRGQRQPARGARLDDAPTASACSSSRRCSTSTPSRWASTSRRTRAARSSSSRAIGPRRCSTPIAREHDHAARRQPDGADRSDGHARHSRAPTCRACASSPRARRRCPRRRCGAGKQRPAAPIVEGYGQSEAGPVLAYNPRDGVRKVGTVGVPLPRTEIEIVDLATGRVPQPPGSEGEIRARGPQLMRGYRQPAGGDGRGLARRLAAYRRHRRVRRRRLPAHLRPQEGDGRSSPATTSIRAKSRRCCAPIRRCARRRSSACRTRTAARRSSRTSCRAGRRASTTDALLAWLGRAAGALQAAEDDRRVVDALPKTGVGKIDKAALRALRPG